MNATDVRGTLREMWETRPARPRADRQVAGVAAAIARRYDIDPVLMRVGFVVAAVTGIGAALYIALWVALPEEPADPAAPRQRSTRGLMVVGLAIATVVTIGTVFGGNNGNTILLSTVVVAALLFLLHLSRGDLGPGRQTTGADAPTVATPTGPSLVKGQPPGEDPLDVTPFVFDFPVPAGPPPPPPPRRFPVTAVTLGVALLAGGLTAMILLVSDALSLTNLPLLLGVVLAVLGSGLVIGSFIRAGRGLIPVALLLGALTWAAVAAPLDRWQGNGLGDLRAAPTTVAQLQPSYERSAGEIDLDLRGLDLTVAPGGNDSAVRSRISLGAGEARVRIPDNADLQLTASAGIGRVTFQNRAESGTGPEIQIDDLGADGVRSGRQLVLEIETGMGNVEVRRG